MERIEALISKLKEQFEQNAGAAQMLATVQMLHHELSQMQGSRTQNLGTAKVSVVMPSSKVFSHNLPEYEKYAPQPLEKSSVKEIKETVLVDKGTLSLVKENGQLDMVFDPMTEIPTLSHQPKEINDESRQPESLNDKLKQGKRNW
ncbi:MAG: hypothetical protein ABUL41_03275 [Chitinophagaceae bacterium]